jgi:HrpA-like RNA helicase
MESQLLKPISDLVITPHLSEIENLIREYNRMAIVAATGSGKSLGLPFYLARVMKLRAWISVPTITAARALCFRQKELCKDTRITVGYAAEGEKHYHATTDIVYGTAGHWRRRFESMHQINDLYNISTDIPDIFMLDEIHIGSLDNDILLAIFDHLPGRVVSGSIPKLILSTATYDPTRYPNVPVHEIPVKSHPVDIRYHHRTYDLTDEKCLFIDMCNLIFEQHKNDEYLRDGHFLIFAPGSIEVELIVDTLKMLFGERFDNYLLLPAYSKLSKDELDLIFQDVSRDTRKIVVATNIAETSITIPGIGVVFDCLMEKTGGTSLSGGMALITGHIFQDSADQRKGRTGRDRPGICYRMTTVEHYHQMGKTRTPEIHRVPLYNMILELLNHHFDPAVLLKDYVAIERIENAIQLLIRLNIISPVPAVPITTAVTAAIVSTITDTLSAVAPALISPSEKINRLPVIHDIGKFIIHYPLSVRNGAFLYHWLQEKNDFYHGVVIASIIECFGPSYIWWPNDKKVAAAKINEFKSTMKRLYGGTNELVSYCKIYNRMMAKVGGLFVSKETIYRYCNMNSLNYKKIHELLVKVRQCLNGIDRPVLTKFNEEETITKAIPIFAKAYCDKLYDQFYNYRGINYKDENGNTFVLDTRRTISADDSDTLISLAEFTITTARGSISLVSIALPYERPAAKLPSTMAPGSFDEFDVC